MPAYIVSTAKELQSFVLKSPKLRDMIGGSALIEKLGGELLDQTLNSLQLENGSFEVLSRAAGGIRLFFKNSDKARAFLMVWPLLVHRMAPNLEIVQGFAEVKGTNEFQNAVKTAETQAAANRNRKWPSLPVAGLAAVFVPQSGAPAVPINESTSSEMDADLRSRNSELGDAKKELLRRICPDDIVNTYADYPTLFPMEVSEVEDRDTGMIAIVHMDANGLGNLLLKLIADAYGLENPTAIARLFRTFSAGIQTATEAAAKAGVAWLERLCQGTSVGKIPCRPLVCAGDDFTILISARYALGFVKTYTEVFHAKTKQLFSGILTGGKKLNEGNGLYVSAGVAFVKSSFPFHIGYELSESLCAFTKNATQRQRSAVSFHRVTTSSIGEYSDEIRQTFRSTDGQQQPVLLTGNPYDFGPAGTEGRSLDNLACLLETMRKLPTGPLRTIFRSLDRPVEGIHQDLERLLQVHRDRSEDQATWANSFRMALSSLTGTPADSSPWFSKYKNADQPNFTPLLDALHLRALGVEPANLNSGVKSVS